VLVFGGSAGAHRINATMLEAATRLGPLLREMALTHQTGAADVDAVRAGYARLGVAVRVEPFIDDMGSAYAAADVVVARAGAMTCAELTAVGMPSVLVPYPFAADDHQRRNAEVLARAGAAEMILERDLTPERLGDAIAGLVRDGARRAAMAASARALGRPEAADEVARQCLQLLAA
jgi:UDP-N-acetylglucosamine--N-acetylmuramyl-(pentapeptide) pyrophosphoryl-undecaprenol N-acetylglucosamine transferase